MRRFVLLVVPAALLWVLVIAIVAEVPDPSGAFWLLMAFFLLMQGSIMAVGNVWDMIGGWRQRRAQRAEQAEGARLRRERDERITAKLHDQLDEWSRARAAKVTS